MNVILFGTTGMVGQGVLRECLLDSGVEHVLSVGRNATGHSHQKLRELTASNLFDLTPHAAELSGYDACFFCLGTSAAGKSEQEYARVSYDLTIAVAQLLLRLNAKMTFIYVSGTGTDSSERGNVMWARVKGRTENALLALGFKAAYMFRPAIIIPVHGEQSHTASYRILYKLMTPMLPIIRRLMPNAVTTTEQLAKGMLAVTRRGYRTPILESRDLAHFTLPLRS